MYKAHTLLAAALLATALHALAAPAAAQSAAEAADPSAAGASAQAEPAELAEQPEIRRYSVEIILFRYGAGVPAGNEVFLPDRPLEPDFPAGPDAATDSPDDAAVPTFGDLPGELPPGAAGRAPETELDPESLDLEEILLPTNRVGLDVLPREALTLGSVHDKLERLDAYEPVLWTGWTQAAVEPDLSPEIPLRRLGNAPPEFDGTLKLYLSRFLHLVVDLTLTPRQERRFVTPPPRYGDPRGSADRFDTGDFGDADRGLVRLRIDEDRIVKNGDLRYFDHPRFGMLAKVTRVEDAEPAPADDTEFLAPAPVER